ncbi:MAG: hypothetical protein EBT20_03260 [Alphaproteobacteria bacterium]|nr:hypothetical protein [Alphaproteobacteria bacterium]
MTLKEKLLKFISYWMLVKNTVILNFLKSKLSYLRHEDLVSKNINKKRRLLTFHNEKMFNIRSYQNGVRSLV